VPLKSSVSDPIDLRSVTGIGPVSLPGRSHAIFTHSRQMHAIRSNRFPQIKLYRERLAKSLMRQIAVKPALPVVGGLLLAHHFGEPTVCRFGGAFRQRVEREKPAFDDLAIGKAWRSLFDLNAIEEDVVAPAG
jgi:hypothetical protein